MDLSILYGTSQTEAYSLRTLNGGLLKTSNDVTTNFQEYPSISAGFINCPVGGVSPFPGDACFMAGTYSIISYIIGPGVKSPQLTILVRDVA